MNRPAQLPDTVLETWAGRNGSAALQWLNDHTQLLQWPRLLEKVITLMYSTPSQDRTVKIFKPLDEVLTAILQSFSSGPPACPCC
jgi:hypothetical protein